jgi:hypothetical protein
MAERSRNLVENKGPGCEEHPNEAGISMKTGHLDVESRNPIEK